MKSFMTCKHANVQDFTECCLDCGYNIYTTPEEYLAELRKRAGRAAVDPEIVKLEQILGITP